MRVRTAVRWGALVVLGLSLGACAVNAPEGIQVSFGYQADDIPMPRKFQFDDQRSWAWRKFEDTALKLRCFKLYYTGDEPIANLVNWYTEQMGQHQWSHVSTEGEHTKTLRFQNDTEEATVTIEKTLTHTGREPLTLVSVLVMPK